MRLIVPSGVFRPRSDTWMLAGLIHRDDRIPGGDVLDLCAGSGALAIAAAQAGARSVTSVDVSHRSVLATRLNATLNRARVHPLRGDLFEPLRGRRFHAIVSNPPYVPALNGRPPAGAARGWDAGPDGRALLDRIAAGAADHLHGGGVLLVVQSSICGVDRTLQALIDSGLGAEVVERRTGPLGPLLLDRAAELELRGLLALGQRDEDLVLIRALKPV